MSHKHISLAAWFGVLQWLEIKPTDDDKTRAKKKKLQKSYKSKKRFLEMDMITKKKQQSWLDFKSGKGAKKKVCKLFLPASLASRDPTHLLPAQEDTYFCLVMD